MLISWTFTKFCQWRFSNVIRVEWPLSEMLRTGILWAFGKFLHFLNVFMCQDISGIESGSKHIRHLYFISLSIWIHSPQGCDYAFNAYTFDIRSTCGILLVLQKFTSLEQFAWTTCNILLLKVQMTKIKLTLDMVLTACIWVAKFLLCWILFWKWF